MKPIDAGALKDNLTDIYGNENRLVCLKDVLDLIDEQPTLTQPTEPIKTLNTDMTIKEAIVHAREVAGRTNVCENCRAEHAQLADWLEELVELRNAQPNEALTLEQLREMKDEPAYLQIFDPLLKSGWHIIKTVTEDKIIFRGWEKVYVPIDDMGKDYNLYRRPPEGEEDT